MHRLRRRSGVAAVAMAAVLALAATACDDKDGANDAGPSVTASPTAVASKTPQQPHLKLPKGLPTSLQDLEKWKNGDWKNWKDWGKVAHQAEAFANPIIKNLWSVARMLQAKPNGADQVPASVGHDKGKTDPEPTPVPATAVSAPYHVNQAAIGKVFFDSPEGSMVCSGTVVEDPEHPGKSNLVWTAGHCTHGGAKGGWYRNITFVPSFNNKALSDTQLKTAPLPVVEPYGQWWADRAKTSSQWISGGGEHNELASSWDYSVLHVKPVKPNGKSLEETIGGGAVPVWFNAPSASGLPSLTAVGYPAAPPFTGFKMFDCMDKPSRLSLQATAPTEYRIGCTMTGGSSGGGWLAKEPNGKVALVSNTSIGPPGNTWLAGPYLGSNAEKVFDSMEAAVK